MEKEVNLKVEKLAPGRHQVKLTLKKKGEGRMKETKKQIFDIIYEELDP